MNDGISFGNLWIIFVISVALGRVLIVAGSKLRKEEIINPEDHKNPKIFGVSLMPILGMLAISIFTPIVVGSLFWMGCVLLTVAGAIHLLSIIAFIKTKKGLTTIGIYQVSRNPMYVAMFLALAAFSIMAWEAERVMGILAALITLLSMFTTHWMVLQEERFLKEKYGATYREYMNTAPRYFKGPALTRKR